MKPAVWAKFTRPPDFPSGDNVSEGWNSRYKGMHGLNQSLYQVAVQLDDENAYWLGILEDPHQLAAMQQEQQENRAKWDKYKTLRELTNPTPASFAQLLISEPSSPVILLQQSLATLPPSNHFLFLICNLHNLLPLHSTRTVLTHGRCSCGKPSNKTCTSFV